MSWRDVYPKQKTLRVKFAPFTVVAAVALTAAVMSSCAKYDGDKAAFCVALPDAPSFMSVSLESMAGTPDEAADGLDDVAETFRELERTAPRSIRAKVSSLGDSSERLAERFRREQPEALIPDTFDHRQFGQDPLEDNTAYWNSRQQIFTDEISSHPGVAQAARELMKYGADECGLTESKDLLGTYAYPSVDIQPDLETLYTPPPAQPLPENSWPGTPGTAQR